MIALRLGVALVLALAAQTTLAHALLGNRVVVDLVLVLVLYVALRSGVVPGLLFGSIAGLCQDALSGGVLGVAGLAKSLVGAATGALATQFILTSTLPRGVVFLAGTIAHAACFLGIYTLIDARRVGTGWAEILPQAVVNAIVGLLLFAVVERLPGVLHRRRLRRTHLRTRVEA